MREDSKTATDSLKGGFFECTVVIAEQEKSDVRYEAWAKSEHLSGENFLWFINKYPDTPNFKPNRHLLLGPDGRKYKIKSVKTARAEDTPWMTLIHLHTERLPRPKKTRNTKKEAEDQ